MTGDAPKKKGIWVCEPFLNLFYEMKKADALVTILSQVYDVNLWGRKVARIKKTP